MQVEVEIEIEGMVASWKWILYSLSLCLECRGFLEKKDGSNREKASKAPRGLKAGQLPIEPSLRARYGS
ncbi:MAG: hypothetical protein ACI8X5_000371 [Planctomycetota bacterium]|jgi:hypothetical protein